jgi:hypothetical protein
MGEIPIPMLIKAVTKHSFSRCSSNLPTWEGYQFLRWSRPIWKLLVRTHKNIHFHDEAATYHITFAIISCRKRTECFHRRGMLRLHVRPTIQPAMPAIYHTGEVFALMPTAESRAEPNSVQCRHRLQILQMTSTTQSEGRWIDYDWGWAAPHFILRPHGLCDASHRVP